MAYNVNGKTYTDHPLMDEIVNGCKIILNGIVIKNDVLAGNCETETSLQNSDFYFIQQEQGSIGFDIFPFTKEIFIGFGYSNIYADKYLKNRKLIPENDRIPLMQYANEYFRINFEEENDYYRMLMGLPPFNSGEEYYVWLTSSDIPGDYDQPVRFDLPLHEQPSDLLNVLYMSGKIQELRSTYVGSSFSYMQYLGDRSIDLNKARTAAKWDILYMPNVYYLIEDKFTEYYRINREMYINKSYQEFFANTGEYYDQMMILIVLAQTFTDMITDVPEWYIRRDIFDIRSCKYFLESFGVKYFKEIPLKYQIRIVKNINTLIKYKSSDRNIDDIIDIFDAKNNISIYRYWMHKKRISLKEYDLEFITSEYNESYDNYIKDSKYRTNYNSMVRDDKYWDAEDDHETVKSNIIEKEFTIDGTKYLSIEYHAYMRKYLYQIEYMLGLILDSNLYSGLSDISIGIPSIAEGANFKISDLFLLMCIASSTYYIGSDKESELDILKPDVSEGSLPTIDELVRYDWNTKTFPEFFRVKNGRIHSFNSTLDKEALIHYLKKGRHSHYRFGASDVKDGVSLTDDQYYARANEWITELGIHDFIVPDSTINNINDLVNTYETNTRIFENLRTLILNAPEKNEQRYLEYVYQELFTRPYDTGFYTKVISGELIEYDNLLEILRSRDYVLYRHYNKIMAESSVDTKQDMLRELMNDVVDTLEYYLSGNGLEYLYSFIPINSFFAITKYIYLMVGFFKSFKVYLLDPYYMLESDDEFENTVRPIDVFNEYKIIHYKWDKSLANDAVTSISVVESLRDDGEAERSHEIADIYSYYDPDPLLDLNFDGGTAEGGEDPDIEDIDCGGPGELNHQYITANGGHSYLGTINFNDMNGGEANETYKEYYHLDGGEANDPDADNNTAMGRQMFNYMVDGGASDGRYWETNIAKLKLIGTELIGELKISKLLPNYDYIQILEDGLYISEDIFIKPIEFENLVYSSITLQKYIDVECADAESSLRVLAHKELLIERIEQLIQSTIGNMLYAVEMNTDNGFINKILNYLVFMRDVLLNTFPDDKSINPYAWEELGA